MNQFIEVEEAYKSGKLALNLSSVCTIKRHVDGCTVTLKNGSELVLNDHYGDLLDLIKSPKGAGLVLESRRLSEE